VSLQERDQVEAQYTAAKEQMDAAKAKWDMAREGTRSEDRAAAHSIYYQAQSAFHEASAYAEELVLKSPITGEIEKTVFHAGEIVPAGFPVVTLVDTADVWVVVQVKETAMAAFKKGTVLSGSVPALGGERHSFTVCFISPMADFATWRPTNQKGEFDVRTFEIHARPATTVPGLRAGMTVLFSL
jgi:HlyD family secretion protein